MTENKNIFLSDADPKKLLVDVLEETHLQLYFKEGLNAEAIAFLRELESTFYMPAEQYIEDFQIFLKGEGVMNGTWMNAAPIILKDGTRVTALSLISTLTKGPPAALVCLKKNEYLPKRLRYMIDKFKEARITEPTDGPNKNYLKYGKAYAKRKPLDARLRHECFKRDSYRCKECGATNKEKMLCADHIVPVSQGGTDELDNLQTLCDDCNQAKYNKTYKTG